MTAEVVLSSLRKEFGNVVAVDEISLTVAQGELVCLLGPSGSGKTTVLRLMAGFGLPTSGEIYIGGEPCSGIPPQKRNLGMVAQDYALFPHMSVAKNVSFGLRIRRLSSDEVHERVEAALAMVDLDGYGERMPHQLSGGQQQRVALARALVTRPAVLLLDEPFGALDKQLREQMQIEVRRLQQRLGITTIFVTHDQSEALTMSDRIAVMRSGRIEQIGTPAEIYESPQSHFVADFIGMTSFLPVVVKRVNSKHTTVEGAGGAILTAPVVHWAREGMRVELAIRPEKVSLTPGPEHGNILSGRVVERLYLGNLTRFAVQLADGSICRVMCQNDVAERIASIDVDSPLEIFWPASEGNLLRP